MQNFIKTKILIAFLIFGVVLLAGIIVLNSLNPKVPPSILLPTPAPFTPNLNLTKPNLNPSVKPGLTKPWGIVDDLKVFKIAQVDKKCDPEVIIVETKDKLDLVFTGDGGFLDKGIEEQKDFQKKPTTVEVSYYFTATVVGTYAFSCPNPGENPDKPKGELIIK